MKVFTRRPAPPDWVRDACLGRGEKVLAWTRAVDGGIHEEGQGTGDGTYLVGTHAHLYVVSCRDEYVEESHHTEPVTRVHAFAWERVQRAEWDQETSLLKVERVIEGEPLQVFLFSLDQAAELLQLVRERVTASIVLRRRVDVVKKKGFTVVARRAPAGAVRPRLTAEALTWNVEYDAGIDPADPAVQALVEATLVDGRESLGV